MGKPHPERFCVKQRPSPATPSHRGAEPPTFTLVSHKPRISRDDTPYVGRSRRLKAVFLHHLPRNQPPQKPRRSKSSPMPEPLQAQSPGRIGRKQSRENSVRTLQDVEWEVEVPPLRPLVHNHHPQIPVALLGLPSSSAPVAPPSLGFAITAYRSDRHRDRRELAGRPLRPGKHRTIEASAPYGKT